ncbi:MAG: hypothetical protein MJ131_09030 [Lachnospiraceae bacterium]|nr:hypothetical protein [Lachnospiraceae bacterium]
MKEANFKDFLRRNFKTIIYISIICIGLILAVFMLLGMRKKAEKISLNDDGFAIIDFTSFSTAAVSRANRLSPGAAAGSSEEQKALAEAEDALFDKALLRLQAGSELLVKEDGIYSGETRLNDTTAAVMNNGAYILLTAASNRVINEEFTRTQLVRGNYIYSGVLYYENLEKTAVNGLLLYEMQDGFYIVLKDFSIRNGSVTVNFEESDIVSFSKREIYRVAVKEEAIDAERFVAGDMSVVTVAGREYFYEDFLDYLGKSNRYSTDTADNKDGLAAGTVTKAPEGSIGSFSGIGELPGKDEGSSTENTLTDGSDSDANPEGLTNEPQKPGTDEVDAPSQIGSAERFTDHDVYQYFMGKRLEYGKNNRINELKGELYSVTADEYIPVFGTPLFYKDEKGLGAFLSKDYILFDYTRSGMYRLARYTELVCREYVVLARSIADDRTREITDMFLYDGESTYIFPAGSSIVWGDNLVKPEGLSMVSFDDGILYIYDLAADRLMSHAIAGSIAVMVIPAEGFCVNISEASVYRGTECLADLGEEPGLYPDYFEIH